VIGIDWFVSMKSTATNSPDCVSGSTVNDTSRCNRSSAERVVALGKFLFAGEKKFWMRSLSYEPPLAHGDKSTTPAAEAFERDLEGLLAAGVNTLWLRGVPPNWFADSAARLGLRLFIVPNTQYSAGFLDDRAAVRRIEQDIRSAIEATSDHPAILGYALGPGIPGQLIRWHGSRRIERFIKRLFDIAKATDPNCLVTYEDRATTAHLTLPFLDFACFHVDPTESDEELRVLIDRLQNLCGEKPLALSGLPVARPDPDAKDLSGAVQTAFSAGCAGVVVELGACKSVAAEARVTDGSSQTVHFDRLSACHLLEENFRDVPFAANVAWPRISIVVCSYNGAATIRDTLEGIRGLEYPNFQAIVVNDGSTDATASIAAGYEVELISTENRGLSNARNTGWQAANGEIVAYIDDDAYPDPHWLHYLALTFMRTSYVGVGGPNIAPAGDGPIADCVANAPGGPVHVLLTDTDAEHIPGCNMAFKREALSTIDGFDPRYRAAGDDVDLCWRLQERGWRIGFSAAAVVWHHRRNSLRTYWKQQQGYGKAEALLVGKWPEKYNAFGHYAWSGRLYGKGLTQPMRLYDTGLYRGAPTSTALQSMNVREAGLVATLPLMPEWFVMIACFGVLTLLGLSWPPLGWFMPLLVLATVVPLAQAAISAAKAEFPTRHDSKLMRAKLRVLTALLHVMQPLARLKGRLQNGLTPWRAKVRSTPTWQFSTTVAFKGSRSISLEELPERLAERARRRSLPVRRGGRLDDWDIEIVGGIFGGARALFGPISEAASDVAVARTWSHLPRAILVPIIAGLLTTTLAAQQTAWLAAAVMGAGTVAVTLVACLQAASAHAALRELFADALQSPSSESTNRSETEP
jgi:GT2 family glycosyltransferase